MVNEGQAVQADGLLLTIRSMNVENGGGALSGTALSPPSPEGRGGGAQTAGAARLSPSVPIMGR